MNARRKLVTRTLQMAVASCALLAATQAQAQCPYPSATCICGPSPADGVLEGTILIAIPPLAEFVVEAVHGTSGGYAVGDRVGLPWRGADAEDLPMLLNLRDGEVVFRQRATDDGRVVCVGSGFYAPVEDAVAAVLSEDCPAAVRDLGLEGGACEGGDPSRSDSGGCAAVHGSWGFLAMIAAVAGLLAWRRGALSRRPDHPRRGRRRTRLRRDDACGTTGACPTGSRRD